MLSREFKRVATVIIKIEARKSMHEKKWSPASANRSQHKGLAQEGVGSKSLFYQSVIRKIKSQRRALKQRSITPGYRIKAGHLRI
jgi:hypothetical protein